MIFHVVVQQKAARTVSGDPRRVDDGPVREDLASGWTLCSGRFPAQPHKLSLIGARYSYTAMLRGYQLPEGLCICRKTSCVCRSASKAGSSQRGSFVITDANRRSPTDRTTADVLYNEQYHDEMRYGKTLDGPAHAVLSERWTRAHASNQRPAGSANVERWKLIVDLSEFLAIEGLGTVRLASQPLDIDELAAGQLVLLARSESEAARADINIEYTLPGFNLPLRLEDVDGRRLVMDCDLHDPTRFEQHLQSLPGRDRRLAKADGATDGQTERQRKALDGAGRDGRMAALIERPEGARRTTSREQPERFDPHLDAGQRRAANAALAADDVLIVQGPPGTGKTTFICETVRQHLACHRGARVLLAAQTHQAIDNVLKRLAAADPELPMVRLGSKWVEDKIDEDVRKRFWIESPEPWMPFVQLRAQAYRRMARAQLAARDAQDPETLRGVLGVQDEYLQSEGAQRQRGARLEAARVVAGTCSGVSGDPTVRKMSFAVAVLEEAGKATPPEALMVMLKSPKSILIGDSRQLPPHVWHALRRALRQPDTITTSDPEKEPRARELAAEVQGLAPTADGRDAFAEDTLFDHFIKRLADTSHEATLTTQYRMVPAIGELVSNVFYGGVLRHGRPKDLSDRDPRVTSFAGQTQVRMLDVPGRQQHESATSKSNLRPEELVEIRRELAQLQLHAADIGAPKGRAKRLGVSVIAPYTAQVKLLRRGINLNEYPDLNVRFGIVDRFQGDEDTVVFVSFVNTTYAGFLKKGNRINVALSRARDLLVITTQAKAARSGRIGEPLKQVVAFISDRARKGDSRYEVVHVQSRRN